MNNQHICIVLTGKTKAGKDEVCKQLLAILPPDAGFQRIALADQLKTFVAQIIGIPIEELSDPEKKEAYREKLIFAGKLGRLINKDTWVSFIKKPVLSSNTICTDVRFKNELGFFDSLPLETIETVKVVTVRILASDENRIQRGANPAVFTDESEIDLDDVADHEFDFLIENNGTMEALKVQVTQLRNYLMTYMMSTNNFS